MRTTTKIQFVLVVATKDSRVVLSNSSAFSQKVGMSQEKQAPHMKKVFCFALFVFSQKKKKVISVTFGQSFKDACPLPSEDYIQMVLHTNIGSS